MTGTGEGRSVALIGAREARLGLFPLLREDALSLVLFFGPGHAGSLAIVTFMLLDAVSGAVGGVLLLLWAVFSFFVCLQVYARVDERERHEKVARLALAGLSLLASRVVELYSRPVSSPAEEPRTAEVFALYRLAQQSLEEEKDPRRAGEIIERGVSLADEILAGSAAGEQRAADAANRGEPPVEGNRHGERKER